MKYVVAPYGFTVRSEIVDPLEIFKELKVEEFPSLIVRYVYEKSPYTKIIFGSNKRAFWLSIRRETHISRSSKASTINKYYKMWKVQ